MTYQPDNPTHDGDAVSHSSVDSSVDQHRATAQYDTDQHRTTPQHDTDQHRSAPAPQYDPNQHRATAQYDTDQHRTTPQHDTDQHRTTPAPQYDTDPHRSAPQYQPQYDTDPHRSAPQPQYDTDPHRSGTQTQYDTDPHRSGTQPQYDVQAPERAEGSGAHSPSSAFGVLPPTDDEPAIPVGEQRWFRRRWVAHAAAYLSLLLLWQYFATANDRVPGIDEVVRFMLVEISGGTHGGMLSGEFWGPLALSIWRFLLGLAIGVPAGVLLGVLLGRSRWVRGLLNDTTLALLVLPSVVWAFLAALWFGLTSTAPVMAVALTAMPFVAVNTSAGVRNLDPGLTVMSQAFGVGRRHRTVDLLIGGTLPSLFTGVRLAVMTGWNSLLIVEWFGSTAGVGWRARFWYDAVRYSGFVGWVFIFVLLIAVIDRLLLRRLTRATHRWAVGDTRRFSEEWGL